MVANREQVREQKIQEAIEKLIRGEITAEEYHKISWETHLESLDGEQKKKEKLGLGRIHRNDVFVNERTEEAL
jgi:hypothetical protein